MVELRKLPTWADDEHVFTVVERPRGSTLMAGLSLYSRLGFIPSTKVPDGDALDVQIVQAQPRVPLLVV